MDRIKLEAVSFCNAYSEEKGLEPVYSIDGQNVSWNRSADGYRLPTEAEWEYACRAGTTTPFYMENSPSAEEANYYGHYPYIVAFAGTLEQMELGNCETFPASDGTGQYIQKRFPMQWQVALILYILPTPCYRKGSFAIA